MTHSAGFTRRSTPDTSVGYAPDKSAFVLRLAPDKKPGSAWLSADMRTTARDMARIGLLMKRRGMWNGRRIVSQDYIRRATVPSRTAARMGYAWWILDPRKTVKGFSASGYLNTDMYVFENYDIVIVRTQAPQNGFSGAAESGDYFEQAMPLFRRMVGY